MLQGRREDACALFKRLLALCNDVGLLAEEYDPRAKRMLRNFPQAFSHVGLISTALKNELIRRYLELGMKAAKKSKTQPKKAKAGNAH